MILATEFFGTPISEPDKEEILDRLDAFTWGEDFEAFRERVEAEAIGSCDSDCTFSCFGAGDSRYYIDATVCEGGNILFEIYDENHTDIISFKVSRVSGDINEVEICLDDVLTVQIVLDLLIEPSWID